MYKNAHDELAERIRAETALQEAEFKYRTLVEKVPAITYIDSAEIKWQTLYISPQIESILGVSQESWLEENEKLWQQILHPEDRSLTVNTFETFFEKGGFSLVR